MLYRLLCIGLPILDASAQRQPGPCSEIVRTLTYGSPSFANSVIFGSAVSTVTPGSGMVYFMNKRTGAATDSLLVGKLDSTGSVLWAKAVSEDGPTILWEFRGVIRMTNGNLLFAGLNIHDTADHDADLSTLLLLDDAGNLVWQRSYSGLYASACFENAGGGIVISGWNAGKLLVTQLSADGDVLSSSAYSYNKSCKLRPAGGFAAGNYIYIGGDYTDDGSNDNSSGFWAARINLRTGIMVSTGSWRISVAPDDCRLQLPPGTTFSGDPTNGFLFSANPQAGQGCAAGHLLLMRADSNLRAISDGSRNYSFVVEQASIENRSIDAATGGLAFSVNEKAPPATAWYALLDGHLHTTVQRRLPIGDPAINPIFCFNGYALSGLGGSIQPADDIYQLIHTDPFFLPGAGCSGTDSSWLMAGPLTCTPAGLSFQSPSGNEVSQQPYTVVPQDIQVTTGLVCQQESSCDSLRIHGATNLCVGGSAATFTASRNFSCLRRNSWQVDTMAWKIAGRTDDTTIRLLPNKRGRTIIYAAIDGCGLRDSLAITISGSCDSVPGDTAATTDGSPAIRFPNAFTPNHDGANDLFRPVVRGVLLEFRMSLYSRWGEMVFTTADAGAGWDGIVNGKAVPPGNYIWFCRYQLAGDRRRQAKGTVLLIK